MASSNYRMNVIWTSHGAQLQRDINNFIGQFNAMGGAMARNQRQASLWGQQMKAIGTTIRYALAGATVYAVATAVSALGEFENKLGVINSLAARLDSEGRLQGLGGGLEKLGDHALRMSNKFGIAVDDIQQHMISFYSSFDTPQGETGLRQLREFVDAMANLSLISEGADPAQMSRGLASMSRNIQTGQLEPGRAGEVASAFSWLISRSPIIRGEDIARDVGRLSAARTAARMTPEQILGVYLGASMAGGSTAVVGRGVSQLLTTGILRPTTKAEIGAFNQAVGTSDPTALRQLGGVEILRRMMRAVAPGGARLSRGQQGILGNEEITDEDALRAIGGTRGINLTLATQLFGRQESLRVFLNLLSQGGPKALDDFIKSVQDAEKNNIAEQRANMVNSRRWYQQLAQSQRNIGLTFTRGLEPFFRPVSGGVRRLSDEMIGHPTAAVGIVGGVAAAQLAAKIALGTGLGGLIGKGLGRLPGLNRLGLGGVVARAPQFAGAQLIGSGIGGFQATGIGATRAGSRQNPFWVVIDPQSWFFPGAPAGQGVAPQSPIQPGTPGPLGGIARGGRSGRGIPLLASRLLGPLSIAALLTQTPGASRDRLGIMGEEFDKARAYPRVQRMMALWMRGAATGTLTDDFFKTRGVGRAWDMTFNKWGRLDHPERAEKFLKNVQGAMRKEGAGTPFFAIEGEGVLTIKIETDQDFKRALRAVAPGGVPVKLWNKGNPTFRGRQKTPRRERRGGQ